jgi:hypothetical protein
VCSLIGLSGANRKSLAAVANPRVSARVPLAPLADRETRPTRPSGRAISRDLFQRNDYYDEKRSLRRRYERLASPGGGAGRGGGGGGERIRETSERENEGRERGKGRTSRRSDGVINDRVFNTLYGLAYKLRPVHRSSWQRINGRDRSLSLSLSLSLFLSSYLPLTERNRSPLPHPMSICSSEL